MLATHTQITAGSTRSPPLIGHVTARYDEKYYNRCYRNLLPVILTDIPRPLPHIPYTLTQRAHCSAGEKRETRHMQHSALHSSVRTTKHPGGERGWWRAHNDKHESVASAQEREGNKESLVLRDSHADTDGDVAVRSAA